MPFDKIDIESITEEAAQIRRENLSALPATKNKKHLAIEVFHDLDDPWRDEFFKFIKEHSDATIYHAIASDGVHMLYCPDKDKRHLVSAGSRKGILSPTGRQMMKGSSRGPIVKIGL